jgi:RNA polymerase sigma factor (sigma-70 family)
MMSVDHAGDEAPDAELVSKALSADRASEREAAFAAIFTRYHRRVLAFCGGRLQDPHAAKDAAAETFAVAVRDLANLKEPDKLGSWLMGIAANRCKEEWKRRGREAPALEFDGTDDDDEAGEYEKASRARQAQVDRMLVTVVASFTAAQQRVYHAAIRDGLTGKQLGARLSITPEKASRETYEIITVAFAGFGALVLAVEGRRHCPVLAGILDQAAWSGDNFTQQLRMKILRHIDTCKRCGRCATCRTQRDQLVRPYAPALIPILITPAVQAQTSETIKRRARSSASRVLHVIGAVIVAILRIALVGAVIVGAGVGYNYYRHHHPPGSFPGGPPGGGPAGTLPGTATLSVWVVDNTLTVSSTPPGLSCSSVCHQPFTAGTRVTLTSTYQPGSIPLNWVGCDTTTASASDACTVTMTQNAAVCLAPYDPLAPNPVTPADCRARAGG